MYDGYALIYTSVHFLWLIKKHHVCDLIESVLINLSNPFRRGLLVVLFTVLLKCQVPVLGLANVKQVQVFDYIVNTSKTMKHCTRTAAMG